jgi:hypothetical protein
LIQQHFKSGKTNPATNVKAQGDKQTKHITLSKLIFASLLVVKLSANYRLVKGVNKNSSMYRTGYHTLFKYKITFNESKHDSAVCP